MYNKCTLICFQMFKRSLPLTTNKWNQLFLTTLFIGHRTWFFLNRCTMFTIYISIFVEFILFIMFIFEQHIDEMLFVALYLTYDLKKTLVFACISTLICSCPHDKFQVMDSKFNKPLQADVKITPYPYLSSIIN